MTNAVAAHFRAQAQACRRLGSPFTADLLARLIAAPIEASRFGARILGWKGEPGADALALRAAGALHALALSGRAPALTAAYPPAPGPDAELLAETVASHDAWLFPWLDSPPQTNEVARSGVLLGGLLTIATETGKSLELLEIGASAGLNLVPDRYRYALGVGNWGDAAATPLIECEWRGAAPPFDARLDIAARAGVDLRPVDPALRPSPLLCYVWPDQHARRARLEAALDRLAASGLKVAAGDAAEWLALRLREPQAAGRARVILHSIMWMYLPESTRAVIDAEISAAGARASQDRPLAHLRLEPDGVQGSAAIRLTTWPGGEPRLLGRGDYHGRWADWV
ncbi:DUF2332 family protein [Pikeienuella piscinae]|uniref:DUF2332 family protein n=1 Tax=Pikeienuella piscinae TaxID=2748098 RepID=A0A7L5C168_9RHOB|nr:DUF2332 family protein [Pikeienuella piscinae]QIE56868.1 DUF2332 family protein [Pikeienuella piscinae]